ncbi:phosphoethanolamine transferase [Ideonella sp. 4Y11]|uniref:Phosphoethanolamine transferase n=1 Tax=Ideonella aquatica TaxID=2824119 RepID=A0A940YRY2_9BURK|nr:phosphoethanolamine transferase [Ideonella aquatica]MBQ0961777.1 phosphoethanolamine transferase [Ideonella aquatica]
MRAAFLVQRPGWRFVGFGLGLHAAALAIGFMLPKDVAKSLAWWLVLGGGLWWLAGRRSAQAARRVWLLLAGLFALDIGTQGLLRGYFGSQPQPSVIAESLANTSGAEVAGFLGEQWRAIAVGLGFTAAALWSAWRWRVAPVADPLPSRWPVLALLLLAALLHLNPAMLRAEPLARWGVVYARHLKAQREIAQLDSTRAALWAQRADWQVRRLDDQPRTVVLVIGESNTRLNWGLLGYPRDTTAALAQAMARLPGSHVLLRDAWSAEAFTLPSLRLALTAATVERPEDWTRTPDVTQLARAAGYRVTWLSNQPAHEGWFASMAASVDQRRFINHGNWRDSSATDHDLLPALDQWLVDPAAPYELLVIHLLGQHFHFAQRCPAAMRQWAVAADDDAVTRSLRAAGRSSGIIRARNEYDDAVRCGADVLAHMMDALNRQRPDRALELLYFSDHGQEVGHVSDFAGHSQTTEAGYAIPVYWWSRGSRLSAAEAQALSQRPFRLDWADQAVTQLLAIQSRFDQPALNPFGPDYAPPGPARPQALGSP